MQQKPSFCLARGHVLFKKLSPVPGRLKAETANLVAISGVLETTFKWKTDHRQ